MPGIINLPEPVHSHGIERVLALLRWILTALEPRPRLNGELARLVCGQDGGIAQFQSPGSAVEFVAEGIGLGPCPGDAYVEALDLGVQNRVFGAGDGQFRHTSLGQFSTFRHALHLLNTAQSEANLRTPCGPLTDPLDSD